MRYVSLLVLEEEDDTVLDARAGTVMVVREGTR